MKIKVQSSQSFSKFTYIGETGRPLKTRFYEHLNDATKKDENKPCGKHFSLAGHSTSDICMIGIEQVFPKDDTLLRKRREHFWIKTYNSVNSGANIRSYLLIHNHNFPKYPFSTAS